MATGRASQCPPSGLRILFHLFSLSRWLFCFIYLTMILPVWPVFGNEEPVPVKGIILQDDDKVWFQDERGNRLHIDGVGGIFFKYTNYRIEAMDPSFPASDAIYFTRYRILASDSGASVNSGIRQILSGKDHLPVVDFRVENTPPVLKFTIFVANRSRKALRLRFPSSQRFDFAVLTPDRQTEVWRWSWGKDFSLGFNDLILNPGSEQSFSESWEYLKSYVEDGEYLAFGEMHSLPHGQLTEGKRFLVQANRARVLMQKYFLPLEEGGSWVYRASDTERLYQMQTQGSVRLGGIVYQVLSFLPDGREWNRERTFLEGDSRFVRFDPESASYREWTPAGEQPLLQSDETHRLIPTAGVFRTKVGEFQETIEYRCLRDKKWDLRFRLVPGVGILEALLPGTGDTPVRLELMEYHPGAGTTRAAGTPRQAPASPATGKAETNQGADFQIRLVKRGGVPAMNMELQLRSNGTLVQLEEGVIRRQQLVSVNRLWELAQWLDRQGFPQLRERYGEDDLVDPLEIELSMVLDGKDKTVKMRTSGKDKPPAVFWEMVEQVEKMLADQNQ